MTLACSLALVLLPSAPADVIVVDAAGAGEFTDLQAAIAAAAEDDVLLVRPGTYGPAQIDGKGLSLVADGGGPVSVQGGLSVRQLMQDQQVALIGLRCEGGNGAGEQRAGLTIEANDGVVRVDHCVLIGADGVFYSLDAEGAPGARIEDAAGVSLAHCELRGGDGDQSFSGGDDNRGGEGVWASHSALALYDCDASGGNGGPGSFEGCDLGGAAGHGLHLMESAATVSGSLVLGGDGGGDGLFSCEPGGHGALLEGAGTLVQLLDSQAQGGSGACFAGPGQPSVLIAGAQLQALPGPARSMKLDAPLQEGVAYAHDFQGAAGDSLFLAFSLRADHLSLPGTFGTLAVALPLTGPLQFLGVLPASGSLAAPGTGPVLAPGLEAARFELQPLFLSASAQSWLGTPASAVVIDGAF